MVNRPVDSVFQPWEVGEARPGPTQVQAAGAIATSRPSWRWLWIFLLCSCSTSSLALGAFFWLIHLPATPDCRNSITITSDRAELYCAQVAAESGDLKDILSALEAVGSWSSSHPLYHEAQPLVEKWSWIVLKAAQQQFQNNHLETARSLIGHIPATSPVYASASTALDRWSRQWTQAQGILAKAQQALQRQDWTTASAQVLALSALEDDQWQAQQVQTLAQQISREQQAHRLLAQAVAMAATGDRQQLARAMGRASQIHASTFIHSRAQPYLDQWSDLLLKLGLQQWYAGNLPQVISLARPVMANPNRAKTAQQLIWLSQARQIAQQSLNSWRTSPDQLVKLYQAMMLANRISPDSPYYGQAQSSLITWRRYLGDLARLQTAEIPGRLQQVNTLKLAIAQAQQVPLGHPARRRAQTLIAHWQLTIERLEDRPILVRAHQLAMGATIPNLRAAIATAQQISLNRALRPEAQSWIYIWRSQLQSIEDRPLWQRSQQLARQGNLSQAIVQATAIAPGRALYGEARAAIATWKGQLRRQQLARQWAVAAGVTRPSAPPPAAPHPQTPLTLARPAPSPAPLGLQSKPPLPVPQPTLPIRLRRPAPPPVAPAQAEDPQTTPVSPGVSTAPEPELSQPLR
ncbi:MAG: hypothetical protein KGQ93_04585 [Cyanobacteria bacterium REEB459]|nr:hypothetical protein [Cyanobacteria bacterium REEB459]